MRTHVRLLVICGLTVLHPQAALPQWVQGTADTLVEVFPLSVGNQWTYRYFTNAVNFPSGNPGTIITDSGRAVLSIFGQQAGADSTIWQFQTTRDLIHHEIISSFSAPDRDTSYPIRDTIRFDLIESFPNHQVYRNANPYLIRTDVFPFTKEYDDTTLICRYMRVGVGDSTTFYSWIEPPRGPYFKSIFTFQKNIGLLRCTYNSGTVDVSGTAEHFLLSSTIMSIAQEIDSPYPPSIYLCQNYPNPFNPSTTIRYGLSHKSAVQLAVFNALGQQVAVLRNGEQEAGYHEVKFDGTGMSSGVYFYRLTAGNHVSARKLLLVK